MTPITFGRLQDLPPREAWAREDHVFTPWLAENIDHLSEVIGIPLELTGQEVRVERFAADILARNPQDDSVVLIENQLETTDHSHLGQIMTYLAGLEAKTVVWIAPSFREPHLSAIRWLNEHTADGFSFFAVRLRVVRIADSPFAPVFEVVEKPNDWDKQLADKRQDVTGAASDLGDRRQRFWRAYADRHPNASPERFKDTRQSFAWANIIADAIVIVLWVGSPRSGLFVRGRRNTAEDAVAQLLEPHAKTISGRLGIDFTGDPAELSQRADIPLADEARWPELIDWMEERRSAYVRTLTETLEEFV
ncbi:hypothetical protein N7I30_08700 [Aurantimonas litoralis]|nr:hypothetical protein [Aurantimonas litoralis]